MRSREKCFNDKAFMRCSKSMLVKFQELNTLKNVSISIIELDLFAAFGQ